nr:putative ribonuclease H-like domain-containing protein [Tanacetum cinerariifolium]
MTGNISYLSDYKPYDGGYVSFGQEGGKITGKGIIKTSKLEFENVYFVKDLKYNLFSVSQIYDNKNSVLFIDSECIVLGRDFKLKDDTNVLLKTPRQHNMYSIDLNNIIPHKDLTCLVVKASTDESMLWHRRLGHLIFKTMNKLVRHNIVKGLPSKCFENDHTCVACLKGKQHKASFKTKLVNSVSKPLHTLHMDMFGPTSISSLNHKWYCLVVTDDFSRFTWTFFLKTKDETSGILRNFINEIENLKDLKVKIIRCDNGGEFKNKEMNKFCTRKGIKREFSNARTPQQNRVAERRNRSLIEAARTMLDDAKLPVTFWAEPVNTACYVQNRVLVNKSQNKTPYELFNSRTPAIGFLKLFGCHIMILNTLDHLGKFDAKGDEGYFIGYSMSSKAFRVFNKRTKRVEEILHVDFLENKLIKKRGGPNWLFDIDSLTNSMNYMPVVVAGTSSTNFSGTKDAASQDVKKDVYSLRYIALPNWFYEAHLESSTSNAYDAYNADAPESSGNSNPTATSTNPSADQIETLTVESKIPTVSLPVPTACLDDSSEPSSTIRLISKRVTSQYETPYLENISSLSNRFEDILRVTTNTGDTDGVEADLGNMEYNISASPTPTFRIHKDHPKRQITKPKNISNALKDPSWVEAMQEELFQFKIQNVWNLVDCPKGMDVKSAFLYGTIDEEVYVMQPPGFQDPEFPYRFYKVEKAMYGLHQAPRACLQVLQKKDVIFLSQDKYVGDILKNFGHSDVRSANTPMDKENPWGKDGPGKDVELHLYRSMIGSLMYLIVSRPDIMFAVCACARHQVTPKECHLHAVTRIFRYLKGHPKLGLWYPKDSPFDLVAYSDSDYGGATQDRKSTTEGCQFLGRRLILWQCKKQTIVATYTTEAEYVAAASGCRQVLWIQNLLLDYGLAFCDYHNMIAILEKSEHNVDFHQIVDFVEASHIRYALTINPTVYVSHIRQFWSTARIETTNEGTKILANVDGKPRTISESSIMRNLKLNDEEGISSLPDAELFENLALTGYNILPNQKFTFQKGFSEFSSNIATAVGEGSRTPTAPYHTPSLEAQQPPHNDPLSPSHPTATSETIPTTTPIEISTLRQYSRRALQIAQSKALPTAADEPASPFRDDSQGEAFPTVSGLEAGQNRENIIKTFALPYDSTPSVTSFDADEETKDKGTAELSGDDAPIKGRSLETGEEAGVERSTKRGTVSVPTGSGLVPTASAIFTTASVVTPYSRRKGKEKMVESDTPKKKKLQEQIDVQMAREMEEQMTREDKRMDEQIARDAKIAKIHAEEELQMLIDGLDRNNEVIAKHLHEYEQSATELTIGEKIDLINKLVKYQDHHAKILKYQAQQSKPLSKKEQREFYMSVLRSHSGWKTKHFRGMTLEEIKEKFILVWKQIKDFVPMASKEDKERVTRKGLKLEQGSAKRKKASEDVSEEDLKEMMQLVPVEEVYVEALQVKHPIIDWEI